MEAIYLFTGAKSFRGGEGPGDGGLGEVENPAPAGVFGEGRTQTAQISPGPKKAVHLNEIPAGQQHQTGRASLPLGFSPAICPSSRTAPRRGGGFGHHHLSVEAQIHPGAQ